MAALTNCWKLDGSKTSNSEHESIQNQMIMNKTALVKIKKGELRGECRAIKNKVEEYFLSLFSP
jgi:hypothetical protein